MIAIDNVLLTDDIKTSEFVCNLTRCKGGCCVGGESGAPLEKEELQILEDEYEKIAPYITIAGRRAIEAQGEWVLDSDGDYTTPLIDGKECAYTVFDKGVAKCGIEKASVDGALEFKKPISCHLYPLRVKQYDEMVAVNYHRWDICSPACDLGKELKVPLYKFLKEALIRKFGDVFYGKLVKLIEKES